MDGFVGECCGINKASNHGETRQQQLEAVSWMVQSRVLLQRYRRRELWETSVIVQSIELAAGDARKRSDDLG